MKISRSWLEQFVDLSAISDHDISSRLTMLGIEVESFENLSEKYKGFVVGSVLEVERHPNADRLSLCKVDVGGEIKSIVCGAPNVAAGQKVPVGLVGALVPHNQHDPDGKPFELTRAKIRGVESEGMICSAGELGIGDDKDGIMVLESDATAGKPLSEYLGLNDTIFEISVTPNRSDCLSHLGIARELASAYAKKLKQKRMPPRESEEAIAGTAKVDVADPDLCPRYSVRVIENIKVGPSPRWLKIAVEKAGMRSINNVVDATNYVMLELGQPLHAFDLGLLKRKHIVVRRPKPDEKIFVTLDGKERNIGPDMLMICDIEKTVAIAGVMGGMNSEISSGTTNILIESANFLPSSIRRTSRALGLSTEASYRFERGVDPNLTPLALDRVAEIIKETSAEETKIAKGIIDIASQKFAPRRLELHVENVNRILGTRLASGEIKRYLDSIEIITEKKSETVLTCSVPTFRGDIEREADLIEEVARVHGYERIDEAVQTRLVFDTRFKESKTVEDIRNFLAGAGFNEIITNSLQPTETAAVFEASHVSIANPISEDMAAMRTTMLPGMLDTIKRNISYGQKSMKLFELGKVYSLDGKNQKVGNFLEKERFSLALTGLSDPSSFDRKEFEFDIFDLKSEIERICDHLNLDSWDFISYDNTKEYEESLKLFVNGVEAGNAGQIAANLLKRYAIEQNVYFAELDTSLIASAAKANIRFQPLPRFPFASIDLAFFVNLETPVGDLVSSLRGVAEDLIKDISVFDIYSGKGVPEGKKSVAFTVSLGSDTRTLNDNDIARFIESAEQTLSKRFSTTLRKQLDDQSSDFREKN
ncbi:MAG TPA: phenylalanine--tRNA ligase subunit beta [Candidatus Acidoferrales bacterium]|nr:phenylalanine--tRNA ligase subunit beta [Candidatus Acidoferrales bacterium]